MRATGEAPKGGNASHDHLHPSVFQASEEIIFFIGFPTRYNYKRIVLRNTFVENQPVPRYRAINNLR